VAGRVERKWFIRVAPGEAQIRCSLERLKGWVLKFTAQLEILHEENWTPAVRYDNAHGFCHRNTLHADGSQDKIGVFIRDTNEIFTHAIAELKANWETHRDRYPGEIKP
jgi:hypothetical protein